MQLAFYILCTALPVHLLAYYPFLHKLRTSQRTAVLLVALNIIAELGCVSLVAENGIPAVRLVEFLFAPVSMAVYFFNVKVGFSKLLFTYIFAMDYLMIVKGLGSFAAAHFFHQEPYSWTGGFCCLVLHLAFMPLMMSFFRRTAQKVYETEAPILWHTIWLIPALTSMIVLLFTGAFNKQYVDSWLFLLARVILLVCIFVVYFVLLHSLEGLRHQAALKEQIRQREQILTFQRTQYAHLQEYVEELRQSRRNLRQHLEKIQGCLNSGDKEALQHYLADYASSLSQQEDALYCKNDTINTLLQYYAQHMLEAGIDLEVQMNLPDVLPVPEQDVCVLLGNLLENAWESCSGQKEPYIRIAAELTGTAAITLIVDNTAPIRSQRQQKLEQISEDPGSGIDALSITEIAARYNGTIRFQWDNGMFYASVFLNPQPAEPLTA